MMTIIIDNRRKMKKSVIITDSETMFASMSKKEMQSLYFDNLSCIDSEAV